MTFKKLLIIFTFVITAVIIMLLGTSYAWYQFDNAYTEFSNVNTFTEGLDDLAVVFTNDDNINTTIGMPLTEEQVEKYSDKTTFTITPSATELSGKEVAFQISLSELEIDSVLTNTTDLRWSLYETIGTGVKEKIGEGNFNGLTAKNLIIKPMDEIETLGVTYSYEFRIWLHETGGNQNALMGKHLTGKIKVSTAVR